MLVVEDGTEDVDETALGGVRLLRLPHVRRSRARNAGVEEARTPYVAFLDEDDMCLPGRLVAQQASLDAAPQAVLSYGRVLVIDGAGHEQAEQSNDLEPRYQRLVRGGSSFSTVARLGGPLYTSATMVRRDGFLAAGGFDPAFDAHEDLDLYLRLARMDALVPCLGGPVSAYRMHGANTPSDALYLATLGVTAKHLPDARGAGRRALLERRIDALWGLGQFADARREARAAARSEPLLLGDARFVKRLVALAAPLRLLEARR